MFYGTTNKFAYYDPNIIVEASNVKVGGNPSFTLEDFLDFFPNFEDVIVGLHDNIPIPNAVIDMYIQFASDCVNVKVWGKQWKYAMSLFIAHFLVIYIQAQIPDNATAQQVLATAQAKGLISSKSVGDVSVSYDFSSAIKGVESWGQFTTTEYGLQFANLAKLVAKGGMYCW